MHQLQDGGKMKFRFTAVLLSACFMFISCIKCNFNNSFSNGTEKTIFIKHSDFTGVKVFRKSFLSDSIEVSFDNEHESGSVKFSVKNKEGKEIKSFDINSAGNEILNIEKNEEYLFEIKFTNHTGVIKIKIKELDLLFNSDIPEPVTI